MPTCFLLWCHLDAFRAEVDCLTRNLLLAKQRQLMCASFDDMPSLRGRRQLENHDRDRYLPGGGRPGTCRQVDRHLAELASQRHLGSSPCSGLAEDLVRKDGQQSEAGEAPCETQEEECML